MLKKVLCVFPNDPIIAYYQKGEIKERYFNPMNIFTEIHIISFTKEEISEDRVKEIGGNAEMHIHTVGKISLRKRENYVDKIIELVQQIKPDVIRAFNPRLEGWFAAVCAKKLQIPFFLSLHTQHDYARNLMKKSSFKKYLALKYTEKFIEPFVIKNADMITIVFKIIEPYVIKHGGNSLQLLYNRIDYNRFHNGNLISTLKSPLIISVGNLIKEKNHECLIKAMKKIDANCLIIGNGPDYQNLTRLIEKEDLADKISIIKSVPHEKIQDYYKSAKLFALAYDPELEGLPIPVIEAMATGLPVVIPFPNPNFSDGLENVAVFAKREPSSYAEKITMLLEDDLKYQEYSKKSQTKAKDFDSQKIEKTEARMYHELISKR